jgi:hypothetical protein
MDDRENLRYQMFLRVRDFGVEHTTDFAADSLGRQLFVKLTGLVSTLEGHAASESSKHGAAKQGTTTRADARQALRENLDPIRRTARALADEVTGIGDKFRMPPTGNDTLLLNVARAVLADATPLAARFIAHEMSAHFLDDLRDDIAALEAAISEQSSGVGQRVAAGAAIDATMEEGTNTMRKLDVIVKNKYADNPAVLAHWTSASHTERTPRRNRSASPPPPPPASGTGTGSNPPTAA